MSVLSLEVFFSSNQTFLFQCFLLNYLRSFIWATDCAHFFSTFLWFYRITSLSNHIFPLPSLPSHTVFRLTRTLSKTFMWQIVQKQRNSHPWCSQGAVFIKHIITFTLWLHLGDNFLLPSVVIGSFEITLFNSAKRKSICNTYFRPLSRRGMESYASIEIPL